MTFMKSNNQVHHSKQVGLVVIFNTKINHSLMHLFNLIQRRLIKDSKREQKKRLTQYLKDTKEV